MFESLMFYCVCSWWDLICYRDGDRRKSSEDFGSFESKIIRVNKTADMVSFSLFKNSNAAYKSK